MKDFQIFHSLSLFLFFLFFVFPPCFKFENVKKIRAVTRIRTWVIAATTQCTNHYTITATADKVFLRNCSVYLIKCSTLNSGAYVHYMCNGLKQGEKIFTTVFVLSNRWQQQQFYTGIFGQSSSCIKLNFIKLFLHINNA